MSHISRGRYFRGSRGYHGRPVASLQSSSGGSSSLAVLGDCLSVVVPSPIAASHRGCYMYDDILVVRGRGSTKYVKGKEGGAHSGGRGATQAVGGHG